MNTQLEVADTKIKVLKEFNITKATFIKCLYKYRYDIIYIKIKIF